MRQRRARHRPGSADRRLAEPGPVPGRLVVFHLAVPDRHRRTLNKIIRCRATDSLDLLAEVADPGTEPADQAERNLAVDAVTDALAALPFPQRAVTVLHHLEGVIVLHHLEGLSYAEVAAVTRSTISAVRSHLFRARRTLGTKLGRVEVTSP